jgi:hypothetical protein
MKKHYRWILMTPLLAFAALLGRHQAARADEVSQEDLQRWQAQFMSTRSS